MRVVERSVCSFASRLASNRRRPAVEFGLLTVWALLFLLRSTAAVLAVARDESIDLLQMLNFLLHELDDLLLVVAVRALAVVQDRKSITIRLEIPAGFRAR